MQIWSGAPVAHARPALLAALGLAVLVALVAPGAVEAAAQRTGETVAMASAGWHGRAIRNPKPPPVLKRLPQPAGRSTGGASALGTGYGRPGGSPRVRDIQRRLLQLGYRPGPVDGLFGPRTEAATRWFQYKHGLRVNGRVRHVTLAVLHARSKHQRVARRTTGRDARMERSAEPRVRREPAPPGTNEAPTDPAPLTADGDDSVRLTFAMALIAALLALNAGLVAGFFGPSLLRRRSPAPRAPRPAQTATPAPPPAPAPERRPAGATPVVGYLTAAEDHPNADMATSALATLCARRGWSLIKVVHDPRPASARLADRPGLMYALKEIRDGSASGLVVAHLRDFTASFRDLVAVTEWLTEADGFLAAADDDLDTSTRAGRATAQAIIELGTWERQQVARRTRRDLSTGRFTPAPREREIGSGIAALRDRGIPLRAIADALNLAGVKTPSGQRRWQPATVKAVAGERSRAKG
jgi:peptidoglycan hydrolase-like protein with peptidoglycan-binding domain